MADFNSTNLPVMLEKADMIWADNQVNSQYMAKVDAWMHLQRVQTASVNTALQGKDKTVRVGWVNACNLATEACDSTCVTDGTALDSDYEDYTISSCRRVEFKINYNKFRDNLFNPDEAVAKGLLKAMKELDEYLAQEYIVFLNANGGTNEWSGWGTTSGGETTVANAEWNTGAFWKLNYTAQQNRFADATVLTGYNLAEVIYNARANAGNAEGKGDLVRTTGIASYIDPFNLETVNSGTYKTYLVDTGAVAFANKVYRPGRPTIWGGKYTYFSRPSQNLPGVMYDVEVLQDCSSGEDIEVYRVVANYNFLLNPTGCTATRTGILEFKNDGGI